jgi:predicted enzyme related to lactoylglutathione lyase
MGPARGAGGDCCEIDHTLRLAKGVEAMITGLAGASIWSEDLNNLLPFYRDVLGLAVTVQTPGFVVLGGLGLGTHSEVRGRNADPARHMVGLKTNEITVDWKRLKDAGVEFVEDPTDYGNLRIATLKDPEGNLVQLFQSTGAA